MICRADLLRFLWKSQHSVLVFPANVLLENRTKCIKKTPKKTASGSEPGANHVPHGLQLSCSRTDGAENLLSPLNPAKKKKDKRSPNVTDVQSTSTVYVPYVCAFRKWFPYRRAQAPGDKQTLTGRPTASKMA